MSRELATSGPTAWARVLVLFLNYAEKRGIDRRELLDIAALDGEALADPDGRIPLLSLYDLVEAIEDVTQNAAFGLEVPLGVELEALDALGFLFITSDTFGDALERMLRYLRLWNDGEHLELVVDAELACMSFEPYGPIRRAHIQMAQATFSDLVVNSGRFVPGLGFELVRFRQECPADPAEYQRILGVPVEFGCARNEVSFQASMLGLRMPSANAAICAFFDRYARDQLDRLPQFNDVIERLRNLIRQHLPEGEVRLGDLAPRLHVSERTLQRRLAQAGTTLQNELDEVRRQQALYFLEHGTAIVELSWLLGYSEPAAFHRAFKRWTGTSPEAWRSARRATAVAAGPR